MLADVVLRVSDAEVGKTVLVERVVNELVTKRERLMVVDEASRVRMLLQAVHDVCKMKIVSDGGVEERDVEEGDVEEAICTIRRLRMVDTEVLNQLLPTTGLTGAL